MHDNAVSSAGAGIVGLFFLLVELGIVAVIIAAMWRVFTKAGQPGWACLIPIFNVYILLKIAGKPGWWLILFLIPIANLVVAILVALAIARNFGKSDGFAIGLILLPMIFYPILAFCDAQYSLKAA